MATKVRKTLTLDQDIVNELREDDVALSATVNSVLRDEVERRKNLEALGRFVAELDELAGEPDPALVEEYRKLFR
ncbi:MAG: type II toxin-antitoxin system CcdA family antitoxin [Bifidobacteriaceae bacterium]|nr:type II toxin-antitoxin system CcdA family antitoxin [Bifidobacteriaceae bacterium]